MKKRYSTVIFFLLTLALNSCTEFLEIDTPRTDLTRSSVFSSDATAKAALSDIYYQMLSGQFANGSIFGVSFLASLSADELVNYNTSSFSIELQQFYQNGIVPTNTLNTSMWREPYQYIYKANAIIEGLNGSTEISAQTKQQLEGEAKFIRAFAHFYLVNLFGDIPLILTTDYRANSMVSRTSQAQVYDQIIVDLEKAKDLLPEDYSFALGERVSANKGAATALLARVFLYIGEWANAEKEATAVIDNSQTYSLVPDLNSVFLKNSSEAILQLANVNDNTQEAKTYTFASLLPSNGALSETLINSFEVGDERLTEWTSSITVEGTSYYIPSKYKATESLPVIEYSTILRLAEQYLIRAEARAHLNDIVGAQQDLNAIRHRAKLPDTSASDQSTLLLAVQRERKAELFTEWGHRWFDLKRIQQADAVLGSLKPNWSSTDALYPIPNEQILNDPNMENAQNPGY